MSTAVDEMFRVGQLAQQQGRLDDAERAYRAVLVDEPEHPEVLNLLGAVQLLKGDPESAARNFRHALEGAPERPDFHCNLGVALRHLKQYQDAVHAVEAAIKRDPQSANAYQVLGDILADAGDLDRAAGAYREALNRNADAVGAKLGLGTVLFRAGHHARAEQLLADCYQALPDNPQVIFQYALAVYQNGTLEKAGALYGKLARFPAHHVQGRLGQAGVELELGRPERALDILDELEARITTAPQQLYFIRANALGVLDRVDEAIPFYREVLAQAPDNVQAWYELARLAPRVVSDRDLAQIRKAAQKVPENLAHFAHFAIAKVMEHRQEHDAELQALNAGNALKHKWTSRSLEQERDTNAAYRHCFGGDFFRRMQGQGDDSVQPLFILGMPRSGTTLTEQILAAHADVEATGENRAGAWAIREMAREAGADSVEALFADASPERVRRFAGLYLRYTREQHGVQGAVFTDKAMTGYRFAGLLAAAFPRARFIELSRHPMDLGFGCYKQLFTHGHYYTYDFDDFATELALFREQMAFWHAQLPTAIHRLVYEQLVADQEGETRALLEHCGLEWDPACLDFHTQRRAVVTASQAQVRDRLNTGGVGRWRRYGEGLAPLRRALEAREIPLDPAG